jgi:hypothetical protein
MEINEVKIGDMVSFMHKKKKITGTVIYRHDGNKNAALLGHINVRPIDADARPHTLHVSKLKLANKIKEDIQMEKNINEAILDLIDNIEDGNHLEANNIFTDLLQSKIDELLDTKKVEVSLDMFNTQTCADCDEDVELEEGEVKTANKAKKNEYMRSVHGSPHDVLGFGKHGSGRSGMQTTVGRAMHKAGIKPPKPKMNTNSTTQKEDVELDEALKGDQHKIDANKNGKIDAMDFKMLRKKKGMKKESSLSEDNPEWRAKLKKDRNAYWTPERVKAAQDKATSPEEVAKRKKTFDDMQDKNRKMQSVINTAKKNNVKEAYADAYAAKKAAEMKKKKDELMTSAKKEYDASQESKGKINTKTFMKKEDVEHIDELSKKTLSSYVDKAKASRREADNKSTEKHLSISGSRKSMKRSAGITNAYGKMKEDVEQVDELNTSTLKSYVKKAGLSKTKLQNTARRKYDTAAAANIDGKNEKATRNLHAAFKSTDKAEKRSQGIAMAKQKMKEDVEMISEEEYDAYRDHHLEQGTWDREKSRVRSGGTPNYGKYLTKTGQFKKKSPASSASDTGSHSVHIGGKKWKSFSSQGHANNVAKKLTAKGGKQEITVHKDD